MEFSLRTVSIVLRHVKKIMKTDYDDSNWREESIPYYTGTREKLLKEGPKSLSQSWILGSMYNEWKRRNGYKDPEPPNCQSSFKEWNDKVK
jgi:hypothetical protein